MTFEEIDSYVKEKNIGGWLLPEERCELFALAGKVSWAETIVELGCYKGLSTIYLAGGAKGAVSSARVFSVDNFEGPPDPQYAVNRDRYFADPGAIKEDYYKNTHNAWLSGMAYLPCLLEMDTIAASKLKLKLNLGEVGLLLIDADHSYAGALNDFVAWYPKVVSGGTVVMHNASGTGVNDKQVKYPGVMKVFAEAVLDGRLLEPRMVGTMGIGVKP